MFARFSCRLSLPPAPHPKVEPITFPSAAIQRRKETALLAAELSGRWSRSALDAQRQEIQEAIAASESELGRLSSSQEQDARSAAMLAWLDKLAESAEKYGIIPTTIHGVGRPPKVTILGPDGAWLDQLTIVLSDQEWQRLAQVLISRVEVGGDVLRVEWSAIGQEIFGESDKGSQLMRLGDPTSCTKLSSRSPSSRSSASAAAPAA